MLVLGIDPGTYHMGVGVVDSEGDDQAGFVKSAIWNWGFARGVQKGLTTTIP